MATVGDVSEMFEVSPQTVRGWCKQFAEHLSEGAKPPTKETRIFDDNDLAVFALVAQQREQHIGYESINEALKRGKRGEVPRSQGEPGTALAVQYQQELAQYQQDVAAWKEEAARRAGEVTRLEEARDQLRQERDDERARYEERLAAQQELRIEAERRAASAEGALATYRELHQPAPQQAPTTHTPPIDGTSALDGSQEGKIVPFPDVEVTREQPRRAGLGGLLDRLRGR